MTVQENLIARIGKLDHDREWAGLPPLSKICLNSTFALLQLFLHLRRTALQYGRLLMTLRQIVNNDDDGDENNDDIGDDDGECAHVIGCADMCAA